MLSAQCARQRSAMPKKLLQPIGIPLRELPAELQIEGTGSDCVLRVDNASPLIDLVGKAALGLFTLIDEYQLYIHPVVLGHVNRSLRARDRGSASWCAI